MRPRAKDLVTRGAGLRFAVVFGLSVGFLGLAAFSDFFIWAAFERINISGMGAWDAPLGLLLDGATAGIVLGVLALHLASSAVGYRQRLGVSIAGALSCLAVGIGVGSLAADVTSATVARFEIVAPLGLAVAAGALGLTFSLGRNARRSIPLRTSALGAAALGLVALAFVGADFIWGDILSAPRWVSAGLYTSFAGFLLPWVVPLTAASWGVLVILAWWSNEPRGRNARAAGESSGHANRGDTGGRRES